MDLSCNPPDSGSQSPAACILKARVHAQLRGKEVGEHEAKLQAWRLQTQEETQRHLQERETTLAGWQTKLDARSRDLDGEKKALQVSDDLAEALFEESGSI